MSSVSSEYKIYIGESIRSSCYHKSRIFKKNILPIEKTIILNTEIHVSNLCDGSIVVSIRACQAWDPGPIPGHRKYL